jgi:phage antirepressor YoqD-like protein
MSTLDYQSGLQSGLGAGYAAAKRVKTNLNSWVQHAERLQARIQELEAENRVLREKVTFSYASTQAAGFMCNELAAVVERVAPTAALADPAARRAIRRNHLAALLLEKGYTYDPEKGELISGPTGPLLSR